MSLIKRFQKIDPAVFNRWCAIIALLFLEVTITGKMVWRFRTHTFTAQDFPQYYMAGVVADHGAWESLYPIPRPGSPRNPGFIENSIIKPGYWKLAQERGVGDDVRFMQPPPFAVILMPLGLLPYLTAFIIWNQLNTFLAWGITLQAANIFRICRGKVTRADGWIILLIGLSPEADRWVRVQNLSALIGFLIGLATLALLSNRRDTAKNLQSALAVWLMGLMKYVGIIFVPLYIAMRRWQTLAWLIGITAVSMVFFVWISGSDVYHEFIYVILPTMGRSDTMVGNQALQGFILRVIHQNMMPPNLLHIVLAVQIVVLIGLMILMFKHDVSFWKEPIHVFAAACALTLWMMIFSPLFWEHYTAYAAPFWGWMIWEATRGRVRRIIVIICIAAEYVPTPIVFTKHPLPEPLASHMLWGTCVMFGLAVWRLMNPVKSDDARIVDDSTAPIIAA